MYYLGSAKQASDYETTTEFLINHIKGEFHYGEDIGNALSALEPYDMEQHEPSLRVSTSADDEVKAAQNRQYEIVFKAELDVYMKRKENYKLNLSKSYAFLWSHCAKSMQSKLEARKDYSTIKGNPIELLKAIKQHALNYQEYRYEMAIILDALTTCLNLKQRENESLIDYTKRFKTARDVLLSHLGGPIILTKYVETMDEYDENDQVKIEKCANAAFAQLMAYTYLTHSDQTKYGSLIKGLQTQQSLENNQYPVTVTEANNILSNHKFDRVPKPPNRDRDQ